MAENRGFWRRWRESAFALDLRSLAIFRIAFGIILMCDVIFRSWTLMPMYSDDGVIPRAMLFQVIEAMDKEILSQWGAGTWSLYHLSGTTSFVTALFVVAFVFASLMTIGCWTRLATIASFILLVSLHNRNPFILTSGDTYLRLVMFWCMFLPLGRIWSVDAWRKRDRAPTEATAALSGATAGLVFLVFILYFFTGVAKCNEVWWQGHAMFVVLNLSIYTTEFGYALRDWTFLNQLISFGTVATEILFPPLLLIGYRNATWRWLNLITFCGLHVGIALSMSIGLFSFICCAVWIALIPGNFWDRIKRWFVARESSAAPTEKRFLRAPAWINVVGVFFIVHMLTWNVLNIFPELVTKTIRDPDLPANSVTRIQRNNPVITGYELIGQSLGIGQHFQMFGRPTNEDPWFVYRATLNNGTMVDIFPHGDRTNLDEPLNGLSSMPIFHWRKYHHDLVLSPYVNLRRRLGEFAIEQWNATHPSDEQVAKLTVECYLDTAWPTPILGETRGAVIWMNYPDTPGDPFQNVFDQVIGKGENKGF